MNSSEIHAEQVQRNLARFGTPTYPGGVPGDGWDEVVVIPNERLEEFALQLPDVELFSYIEVSTAEVAAPLDFPVWEG